MENRKQKVGIHNWNGVTNSKNCIYKTIQKWCGRIGCDSRRFGLYEGIKVLAARAAVDSSPPAPRPHVALKAKKWRRESDRAARVLDDNYRLLQRLAVAMQHNRLDNHRQKQPPNFHQKVGRYFDCGAAPCRNSRSYRVKIPSLVGAKCYACEFNKMKSRQTFKSTFEDQLMLPSLYMYN